MCAIFGTIGNANLKLIKEISKKQIYRGPDEQNFYVSEDNLVSFGNNRLSVIDKANGKQPMLSSDKRFVTVFNGCIYNFLEIQKYLKKKEIKFNTNSDTEVVANAYMEFGNKAFNYFDGMWAIAIYDKEKKEVILSRDYVGQKPLYYSKNEGYYIFSSQLNGIFADKKTSKQISKNNLEKYFTYSFVPAPKTIFENVYQLEQGENIIFNLRNLNFDKRKYWDLKNGPDYNFFIEKIEDNNFKNRFKDIVNQHSISDKAPSISLSGGIDSYIIMDNFSKQNDNTTSFTLGFQNKSYDESHYVKKIEKDINKKIYYTDENILKSNFLEIKKLINEPNGDSSIVPTFIIQNKIKKFSNVTLGGDGGDESFFGYITFDAFVLAIFLKKFIPNFIFNLINKFTRYFKSSRDYIPLKTKVKKFFDTINLDTKYLLPSWMCCLSKNDLNLLFEKSYSDELLYKEMNEIFNNDISSMRSAQFYHYKFYLPMILSKIDQASMFNSVENRSPFLSKKILNFSLENDISKLYKFFNKKAFIKNTFKNDIPRSTLNRKKHGFAFPKELILNDKELVDNIIDYNLLLNKKFFIEKYKNFLIKKDDSGQYIWNELILNITLQNLNISKI